MQNSSKRKTLEYLFVATIIIGSIVFLIVSPTPAGKVYNCSIAEISPDYPVKVKEECRKLRAENFSKNLYKPK